MAKKSINVGAEANDNNGDSLRSAFTKINENFTELYTALGINADVNLNLGAFEFAGSVMSTTDSSAIVIDQATTITSNLSVGGAFTFPDNTVQTTAWAGIPGPYADDAAAAAANVAVGYPYHKTGTSGQVFVRLS